MSTLWPHKKIPNATPIIKSFDHVTRCEPLVRPHIRKCLVLPSCCYLGGSEDVSSLESFKMKVVGWLVDAVNLARAVKKTNSDDGQSLVTLWSSLMSRFNSRWRRVVDCIF